MTTDPTQVPTSAVVTDQAVAPQLVLATEAALVGLSVATAVSLGRLFTDWSFLPETAVVVALAHLVSAACRRNGLSLIVTAVVSLTAGAVAISVLFYADTTLVGIPTGRTLAALDADLNAAFAGFSSVTAPVPPMTGYLVAASVTLWVGAALGDMAALREWTSVQATLIPLTTFVFGCVFGRDRYQLLSALVMTAAVLVFVVVHRAAMASTMRWIHDRDAAGGSALLRAGLAIVVVASVGGAVVGPALPGAGSDAVVSLRDINRSDEAREVISPMVEIQARLVQQSDEVAFVVRSPAAQYWRLTSLDEFNGRVWGSSANYQEAGDDLPSRVGPDVQTVPLEQEYAIEALGSIWLPAAFEARSVESEVGLRYDPETATLIVPAELDDGRGLRYSVVSQAPTATVADLDGESRNSPGQRYLELPDSISDEVVGLAIERAGDGTRYQQARALQDFFQTEFTYDLDIAAGHSVADMEEFLAVRRGYCEQFAGTYAAMARAVGIPARVAVGFTHGEPQPTGTYIVRGRYAHAWPEVWFQGVGWVPFEPTPGRGIPGATDYTGLEPAQEGPNTFGDAAPTSGTSTTVVVPSTTGAPPTTTPPTESDQPVTTLDNPTASTEETGVGPLGWLLAALAVVGATVLGLAALNSARRRRRRAAAATSRDRIRLALDEADEWLHMVGLGRAPHETVDEFTRRVTPRVGVAELTDLGRTAAAAAYAPVEPGDDDVRKAEHASLLVADRVRVEASKRDLAARHLRLRDPNRKRR